MLHSYYNVSFFTSIGRLVENPIDLSVSYYDAKQILENLSADTPVLFWDEQPGSTHLRNVFNLSLFRDDIQKAFEELNVEAMHHIFQNIIPLLSAENIHYSQALDAAGNLLHLTITLLSNGEDAAAKIFQ